VTSRRAQLSLLALIIAALMGVALIAVPGSPFHRSPILGLDLQGGLEVTLEAIPPPGQKLQDSDLDRSVTIIRDRIDKLGVAEPEVRKQGGNQISVQLAGVFDQARATDIIGKTAQLELYKLQADLTGPSVDAQGTPRAFPKLFPLLQDAQPLARAGGKPAAYYLFDKRQKLIAGPLLSKKALLETKRAKKVVKDGKLREGYRILSLPGKTTVITCDQSARLCPPNIFPPTQTYFYLFKHDPLAKDPIPEMTGKDLKLSGTRQDFDTRTGEPIVLMQFTNKGADKFHDITRDLADDGRNEAALQNIPDEQAFQNFAIVLDREIQSFPQIDFNENPDGIPGDNGAQITGLDDLGEAKDLALVLQTGALPVKLRTVDQTNVSATLGKDSLREAYHAAIAGLFIVAIFLLVFYRFLGLVAVLGLGIYAAFLYATLLLFDVTLTLPGFAGMILTIGVAADANIVIFERIKEEFRAGRSVRAAIATGYEKGFSTIIDANVVTAITALVLFGVASAGVKGFALMLLIGTVISLFTAVAATRALLGLLSRFRWFDSPRFMGASGEQTAKWLQIDYMGRRNLWFAISGTILLIAVGSLAVRGLNLGIDFKGGTQVDFHTPQPTAIEDVRAQTQRIGEAGAVIQGRGTSVDGKYREFQIRTETLSAVDKDGLQRDLEERLDATAFGSKSVSESFGRQIANSALLAIFVSFFLITLYIAFRFQYKFAGPVLAAIGHDVLLTVGIYSLTGREVTTPTVAAVLTVLGYSMYDTIIIFDRIRENIPLMRRASFATLANVSIWETIRRSLATTFITLLPIGALLFFGGDTLKDFAFALLVGIVSGAYSTIFIATPLLTMWKEREPEYARRIETEVVEAGVGGITAAPLPEPEPVGVVTDRGPADGGPEEPPPVASGDGRSAQAKRERRRQRRRTRPHGRAR
jgi:SecD/SecF fusion protein